MDSILQLIEKRDEYIIGKDDRTVHMVGATPIVPDSLGDKIRIEQRVEIRQRARESLEK